MKFDSKDPNADSVRLPANTLFPDLTDYVPALLTPLTRPGKTACYALFLPEPVELTHILGCGRGPTLRSTVSEGLEERSHFVEWPICISLGERLDE